MPGVRGRGYGAKGSGVRVAVKRKRRVVGRSKKKKKVLG
jgi:hypothetical protein